MNDDDDDTTVGRLRRLLVAKSSATDWERSTPRAPLAPYGQHSDPAAAHALFLIDLGNLLKSVELLVGEGSRP